MDSSSNSGHVNHSLKVNVPAREGQVSMSFARGGAREGAGRKPIGETRKVSITLAPELWRRLERECEQQSRSRSEWLRSLIEDALTAAAEQPPQPAPPLMPPQQQAPPVSSESRQDAQQQ